MKKIMLFLLAGAILSTTACTKTGPQGPQGVAGVDGNANVKGSDAFTVYSNTWTLVNNRWTADYTDQDITASVVDHGVVEIYKAYGTNDWTNLPDIFGTVSTVFDFYDGGFTIYVQNTDGTTAPPNPGNVTFRTVVITPAQKQAHPNTNWKSYTEAIAAQNDTRTTAATQAPTSAQ